MTRIDEPSSRVASFFELKIFQWFECRCAVLKVLFRKTPQARLSSWNQCCFFFRSAPPQKGKRYRIVNVTFFFSFNILPARAFFYDALINSSWLFFFLSLCREVGVFSRGSSGKRSRLTFFFFCRRSVIYLKIFFSLYVNYASRSCGAVLPLNFPGSCFEVAIINKYTVCCALFEIMGRQLSKVKKDFSFQEEDG